MSVSRWSVLAFSVFGHVFSSFVTLPKTANGYFWKLHKTTLLRPRSVPTWAKCFSHAARAVRKSTTILFWQRHLSRPAAHGPLMLLTSNWYRGIRVPCSLPEIVMPSANEYTSRPALFSFVLNFNPSDGDDVLDSQGIVRACERTLGSLRFKKK